MFQFHGCGTIDKHVEDAVSIGQAQHHDEQSVHIGTVEECGQMDMLNIGEQYERNEHDTHRSDGQQKEGSIRWEQCKLAQITAQEITKIESEEGAYW